MTPADDRPPAPSRAAAERAYNAFLRRFASDEAAAGPRDAAAYAAEFPAAADRIAAFFAPAAATEADRADDATAADAPAFGGPRIGRFVVERELGRGGQGTVYLAYDPALGRRVAVKTLAAVAPEDVLRFKREAEVASRFEHPGLCPLYEVGEHAGAPFFAMRYVEGRSLEAALAEDAERLRAARGAGATRHARLVFARAAEVVAAIARALHHAHERGVVHRDVKPGNVVLTADDRPVVLDFGIARPTAGGSDLTRTGAFLGTPAYMAPERLSPLADADGPQVDVYALGVVLYRWLAGRLPFLGDSPEALYKAALFDAPPDLRRCDPPVPADLAAVVAVAMAREPRERYATAADFADDLERWLRGEKVRARPGGVWSALRRFVRRRRAAVLAAVVVVAAVVPSALLFRKSGRVFDEAALLELAAEVDALGGRSDQAWGDDAAAAARIDAELKFCDGLVADAPRLVARRDELAQATRARPDDAAALASLTRIAALTTEVERLAASRPSESFRASLGLRRRYLAARDELAAGPVRAAWDRAVDEIADVVRRPLYGGLRLSPDFGLLPLGWNAEGAFEFEDLWTVEPPADGPWLGARGLAANGFVARDPRGGVVLVLVPGGVLRDGTTVAPFLLAKDELDQERRARIGARDPQFGDVDDFPPQFRRVPSKIGSAPEWTRFETRLRLRLPTEVEWERAARGGGAGPWPWGPDPAAGREHAVCAALEPDEVGRRKANGYGLRDVAGNFAEWCRASSAPDAAFVLRGGSFLDALDACRIDVRSPQGAEFADRPAGVRPARDAPLAQ